MVVLLNSNLTQLHQKSNALPLECCLETKFLIFFWKSFNILASVFHDVDKNEVIMSLKNKYKCTLTEHFKVETNVNPRFTRLFLRNEGWSEVEHTYVTWRWNFTVIGIIWRYLIHFIVFYWYTSSSVVTGLNSILS